MAACHKKLVFVKPVSMQSLERNILSSDESYYDKSYSKKCKHCGLMAQWSMDLVKQCIDENGAFLFQCVVLIHRCRQGLNAVINGHCVTVRWLCNLERISLSLICAQ